MLKFFEQLSLDLMIPVIITAMLYAFVKFKLSRLCRIVFLAGGGLTLAASVFVAILKNTNRELKLPFWNSVTYYLLTALVIASAALIVLVLLWLAVKKFRKVTGFIATIAAVAVVFTVTVNSLPGGLAYPFNLARTILQSTGVIILICRAIRYFQRNFYTGSSAGYSAFCWLL